MNLPTTLRSGYLLVLPSAVLALARTNFIHNLTVVVLRLNNKRVVLVGDFNVAHKEIDLARPQQNQHNIMFTFEEREQLDKLVGVGYTDTFRRNHPEGNHFTWWSYTVNAREGNLGWRIDYIFVSRALETKLKDAFILPGVKGSDHCPIGIEI